MNERIKELTRQAGISILYEYDGYDGHAAVANLADIEKFAELIVGECVGCLSQEHENYRLLGSDYCDNMADGLGEAIELIKEHFGVEE